jgi:hypothetical protein
MDHKRRPTGADLASIKRRVGLRDHGMDLVSRTNRWMVAGALAVTGGVTLLADHAFHASHARTASRASPSTTATSTNPASTNPTSTTTTPATTTTPGAGGTVTQPPLPAAPAPGPAVVSGGS